MNPAEYGDDHALSALYKHSWLNEPEEQGVRQRQDAQGQKVGDNPFDSGSVILEATQSDQPHRERDGKTQKTTTNGFGDFEFGDLAADTEYTVKINPKGYQPRELKALTKVDVYFGEIVL